MQRSQQLSDRHNLRLQVLTLCMAAILFSETNVLLNNIVRYLSFVLYTIYIYIKGWLQLQCLLLFAACPELL